MTRNHAIGALILALLAPIAAGAADVPAPEAVLGARPGTDGRLAFHDRWD